ncbi:MAG: hypothetical protein M1816_000212 [Peltula sp. TS41687]|nr:MAG: hypothetical protein M1816_000212 [Peltula sp. TS41687]
MPASQVMGISFLPSELVQHIFSSVYENNPVSAWDFLQLSLVCKSFCWNAQPFLYRRFSLTLYNENALDDAVAYSAATASAHVGIFLKYPDRARFVQDVYMRGWSTGDLGTRFIQTYLDEEEQTQLKVWIDQANLGRDCWKLIDGGRADYLGVLLISRFLNVKVLDIEALNRSLQQKIQGIMPNDPTPLRTLLENRLTPLEESLPDGVSAFKHLGNVHIKTDDTADITLDPRKRGFYIYVETILPLFYLPAISFIELECIEEGLRQTWPAAPPKASTLTTLILKKCPLSAGNLDMLLQASPNLKKLQWGIAIDAAQRKGWFNAARFRRSLDAVKDSLEHLDLSVPLWTSVRLLYINMRMPCVGIQGSLGSLKDFSNLTYLSLAWPILLGWKANGSARLTDVLPESLETLILQDDMYHWWGYQWDEQLEVADSWGFTYTCTRWEIIERKTTEYLESQPSRLEKLTLQLGRKCFGDWVKTRVKEVISSLEAAGQAVGVKVEVIIG